MGQRAILMKDPPTERKRWIPADSEFGWVLLGVAGAAFFLAGLTDLTLAWIPLHLGNAEWEFGTISRSLDSLPLPLLGISLVLASGVARGSRGWVRTGVVILGLLAVWVVVSAILYALDIPLALRAVQQQPQVLAGLHKSITRTVLQAVLYAGAASVLTWQGWKRLRAGNSGVKRVQTQGGEQ